jgi:hypothetical protein
MARAEVGRVEIGPVVGTEDAFVLFDVAEHDAMLCSDVDLELGDSAAFLAALAAPTQHRTGVVIDLSAARRRTAAA